MYFCIQYEEFPMPIPILGPFVSALVYTYHLSHSRRRLNRLSIMYVQRYYSDDDPRRDLKWRGTTRNHRFAKAGF